MRNYFVNALAAVLLVLGTVACGGMNDVDIDRTNRMDAAAFDDRFGPGGVFDTWDADSDGFLRENEFAVRLFDAWDLDNDNMLETREWDRSTEAWGVSGFGGLADWDTDRDTFVSDEEWRAGFSDNGLFDRFDADRNDFLTGDEFTDLAFDVFDANNDAIVDDTEWDTHYDAWV